MIRWSEKEQNLLISEVRNGLSYNDIAEHHGRSGLGIKMRIQKMIYDMIKDGKSEKSIAKLFGFDIDKVEHYYNNYVEFLKEVPPKKKKGSKRRRTRRKSRRMTIRQLRYENKLLRNAISDLTKKLI